MTPELIPPTATPKVIQMQVSKEDLPKLYIDLLNENPLLGRLEGTLKTLGWTEEQIRTAQLLAACRSNASLVSRLKEYEIGLATHALGART